MENLNDKSSVASENQAKMEDEVARIRDDEPMDTELDSTEGDDPDVPVDEKHVQDQKEGAEKLDKIFSDLLPWALKPKR